MCDLSISDLHFSDDSKKAFVRVRCGKGGKERYVPFSMPAQEAIREYLKHRPNVESNKLFWAYNPKYGYTPIIRDCVIRRMKQISDRCGIRFTAHSFRHYRITRWANSPKIPITMVQLWAGHSSLIVTQRYIHTRNEEALAFAFEGD
jgi:integrase/recombinase XerD